MKNPLRIVAVAAARGLFRLLCFHSSVPNYIQSLKARLAQWERRSSIPIYCGNASEWHRYFDDHHDQFPAKLEALLEGTDERSRREATLFQYRYRYVYPPSEFQGHVFFDPDIILSQNELEAAAALKEFAQQPLPFKFPEGTKLDEFHHFREKLGLMHAPAYVRDMLRGKDAIDGGAYCGDSAMILTEFAPRSIHAFEVFPENVELLKQTIAMNGKEDIVVPVPMGLAETEGALSVLTRLGSDGTEDIMLAPTEEDTPRGRSKSGEVPVTSIDNYVKAHGLTPGVIKLDVEGYEYKVIEGARETIRNFRPVLLISIYHRPKDFFEIRPLIDQYAPGYRHCLRHLCPGSPSNEFMLIAYPQQPANAEQP